MQILLNSIQLCHHLVLRTWAPLGLGRWGQGRFPESMPTATMVNCSSAPRRLWQSNFPFWLCRVAHLQQPLHTEGLDCRCTQEKPATEALLTCRVVLWSEKGELKKVVTMLITISVTYFSSIESACFLSLVLLQAWKTVGCWKWDTQTYSRILRNPLPPPLITKCRTEVRIYRSEFIPERSN